MAEAQRDDDLNSIEERTHRMQLDDHDSDLPAHLPSSPQSVGQRTHSDRLEDVEIIEEHILIVSDPEDEEFDRADDSVIHQRNGDCESDEDEDHNARRQRAYDEHEENGEIQRQDGW